MNGSVYGNSIKFREIAENLKDRINSAVYKQGDTIPSEMQLIKEFNVSRITVRNALSLLVNDGYLGRSQGKGTVVLSRESKESRLRKGLAFGVLSPDFSEDIPTDERTIVNGAILKHVTLWQANLSLFSFRTDDNQLDYMKEIVSRNMVDGLFIGHFGKYNRPVIEWLKSIRLPFVQFSSVTLFEKKITCPLVAIDEIETLKQTLLQYKQRGIRRIHLLGARFGFQVWRTKKLMSMAGIPSEFEITETIATSSSQLFAKAKSAAEDLAAHPDDTMVFIVANEMIAYFDAVMHIVPGVPPENVLLYRHYGDTTWKQWHDKFSYIDRSYTELGRVAADMMYSIMRKKDRGEDIYSPDDNKIIKSMFIPGKFMKKEDK